MKVAAIDCGTNSLRLLIAEFNNGKLTDLVRKTRINRLGYNVDKTHEFNQQALERTYEILAEYAQDIAHFSVPTTKIRFVATSASRDANNCDDFFTNSQRILGVAPEIISGNEEAQLSFNGVVSVLNDRSTKLVVDLGGGSTEVIIGGQTLQGSHSMNIGSVRISERYFSQASTPTVAQIQVATTDICQMLDATFELLSTQGVPIELANTVVGVAGTVTTLTALALNLSEYSRDAISGTQVNFDKMISAADTVLTSSKDELRAMPFMHPGRVDVIQAGSLIWKLLLLQVQAKFQVANKKLNYTITSEHDILDGIALSI